MEVVNALLQRQTVVTSYLKSKQLLLFDCIPQNDSHQYHERHHGHWLPRQPCDVQKSELKHNDLR